MHLLTLDRTVLKRSALYLRPYAHHADGQAVVLRGGRLGVQASIPCHPENELDRTWSMSLAVTGPTMADCRTGHRVDLVRRSSVVLPSPSFRSTRKRQGIEECLELCFIASSTSLSALKRSRDLLWETPLHARRTTRKNGSSGSTRGAGGLATVLMRGPRFSPWEGRPENLALNANGGNLQSPGCLHRNPNSGTEILLLTRPHRV